MKKEGIPDFHPTVKMIANKSHIAANRMHQEQVPKERSNATISNLEENTYINQTMMNSCVTYHGNQVQAIHRSMADFVSLSDARASV